MTTLERIREAIGIVAALVQVDPVYMPILARLKSEVLAAEEAALLASSRRVIRGRILTTRVVSGETEHAPA